MFNFFLNKHLIVTILFHFVIVLAFTTPVFAEINHQNPVLAEVEGQPINLQNIEDKKINDLRKELYKLVQIKLKKEAILKLGTKYPKYKIDTQMNVAKKEIQAFYDLNDLAAQGTLKELSLEIKYYIQRLKSQKQQGAIDHLYQMAVREKLISDKTIAPNDFLIKVPLETAYFRNTPNSGVMFLEFSDYQCPACRMTQPTINQLIAKYHNSVIFAYRHMPLSFHTEADEAALAAECARDQGKFELMHQAFFKNQSQLSKEKSKIFEFLKTFGKSVGIPNIKQYNKCIDDQKYADRIQNDIRTAITVGVTGTPGFIIGRYDKNTKILHGEMVTGGLKLVAFENIIKKYLD